jgi:hypothetical protein
MNRYVNSNLKHWDIKESEIYLKNYEEMKIYFNKQYNTIENKPIMINILLSQFYDGCAVFRNKVSSFHPLVITILNLPPNYRFKIGNDFYCY